MYSPSLPYELCNENWGDLREAEKRERERVNQKGRGKERERGVGGEE